MSAATTVSTPSVRDAAQRVLRATAKSWRLKAPLRRGGGSRAWLVQATSAWVGRESALDKGAAASGGPCAACFALPLAGHGFAISYWSPLSNLCPTS
jgi:hypothetical protein